MSAFDYILAIASFGPIGLAIAFGVYKRLALRPTMSFDQGYAKGYEDGHEDAEAYYRQFDVDPPTSLDEDEIDCKDLGCQCDNCTADMG